MSDAETNRLLKILIALLILLIFIIITGGFGLILLLLLAVIYGSYLFIKAFGQGVKEGIKKSEDNPPSWWKELEKGIWLYIVIGGGIIILLIVFALLYKIS